MKNMPRTPRTKMSARMVKTVPAIRKLPKRAKEIFFNYSILILFNLINLILGNLLH